MRGWALAAGLAACGLSTTGCLTMVSDAKIFAGAQRSHAKGRPERAVQELNFLMAYRDPDPELRARITVTKAQWLEELDRQLEAEFLYRHAIEYYPDSFFTAEARGRLAALEATAVSERPADCVPEP